MSEFDDTGGPIVIRFTGSAEQDRGRLFDAVGEAAVQSKRVKVELFPSSHEELFTFVNDMTSNEVTLIDFTFVEDD